MTHSTTISTTLSATLGSCALILALPLGAANAQSAASTFSVSSPDGRNRVTVAVDSGNVRWSLNRDNLAIVTPSLLGLSFRGAPSLRDSLRVEDTSRDSVRETFTQPWGEVRNVDNHYNELRLLLRESIPPRRAFVVVARAFDDGIAFRYELPEQPTLGTFALLGELTEFSFAEDAKAWWIPNTVYNPDRQEMLYLSSPISRMDTVHTPLTMRLSTGTYAVIHEAHLEDWAGMFVIGGNGSRTLRTALARWSDGDAVKGRTPMSSPWRTLQLADRAEDLAPSVLGLKLNPPSRIADTRWIQPMKYNGIWWGMHVNTMTWESGPLHGATTENTRRYMDFAAANGLGGTLVEGWNVGWDGGWMTNGHAFSFTQSYPDYDLPAVAAYAREKGVALIMHNETSNFVENYERQLDSAYALYERLGIHAIKTGYVGDTTQPGGHEHQSQYMVRHHRRVLETAAKHKLAINMHEPVKDAGERRTWPNMLSREGARGMEFNAWGGEGGNPPEHETILFFTRLLAGPMDFTPGIFNLLITRSGTNVPRRLQDSRPRTTLAKQLALYVVLYSPLQMAADLPENYEAQPAFQFIRDVAVDWDTTRVLAGEVGDYVAVARRARDSGEWFIGAISDEKERTLTVRLDFLSADSRWIAETYADGAEAHWAHNPLPVTISEREVTSATTLDLKLAAGGGQAIRLRPVSRN